MLSLKAKHITIVAVYFCSVLLQFFKSKAWLVAYCAQIHWPENTEILQHCGVRHYALGLTRKRPRIVFAMRICFFSENRRYLCPK